MIFPVSPRACKRAIVPVTAIIMPPLGILAPLGIAPLLALAGFASLFANWTSLSEKLAPVRSLIWLIALLGVWATTSSIWSIIPGHSALEGGRFLIETVCGFAFLATCLNLPAFDRTAAAYALAAGILIASLLLAIERFGGEPIAHWWHGPNAYVPLARYDRGVTILVLLMWPMLAAEISWVLRAIIGIIVVSASVLMLSTAAMTAALVSLVVAVAARLMPRLVTATLIFGVVAVGISIPLVTPTDTQVIALHERAPWIKWSGIHRLLIWRFGADRVAERPLLGWGMDASRAIPGGTENFNDLLPDLHYPTAAEAMPLHPHDATLQWQLELGIPGLFLGLSIVAWLAYRIGWKAAFQPGHRAGALALTSACLIIGLLSFGIWQSWWVSTLWLVGALFAVLSHDAENRPVR
jgi:O-antigen ligase